EARLAADERAARESEPGQGLWPAGGDAARAVGNALATFEKRINRRMRLEALKFLKWRQIRIAISQANDKADADLAVLRVVQERATVGMRIQWPAGAVHDQPGLVLGRIDVPEFLDADRVGLRIAIARQVEARDQLLAQMAP